MFLNFGRPTTPPADPVAATREAIAAAIEANPKSYKQSDLEARRAQQAAVIAKADAEHLAILAIPDHLIGNGERLRRVSAIDATRSQAVAATAATKAELCPERENRVAQVDTALAEHNRALAVELIATLDRADALVAAFDLVAHARVQLGGSYAPPPMLWTGAMRRFAKRQAR